jgi:hypothetical protein
VITEEAKQKQEGNFHARKSALEEVGLNKESWQWKGEGQGVGEGQEQVGEGKVKLLGQD